MRSSTASRAEADGWGAALTLVCLATGAVLLAGFVVLERRSRQPLLPPRVVTVGIALLSTFAATATNSFIARQGRSPDVIADAAVRGYTTAFWWSAGIFAAGAVVCGLLLRPGVPRLEAAAEPVAAAA